MAIDLDHLRQWVNRSERLTEMVAAMPVTAMAATLDRDDPPAVPGTALPPLWHWMLFNPAARQSVLGPDGHPARGEFLPPVELPRRMWAGGRLNFVRPLRVGELATKTSRITEISAKSGRSGELVFVTVQHEIAVGQEVALTEEHDIVYREAARPGAVAPPPQAAPSDAAFERTIVPDPVLLFRYSALTFNGHRIHYDRSYVTGVEGYPGLIVHGPLIATLLLDLLRRNLPAAEVRSFSFRAVRPLFDIAPFAVCGRPEADGRVALWARDDTGALAMEGSAQID